LGADEQGKQKEPGPHPKLYHLT